MSDSDEDDDDSVEKPSDNKEDKKTKTKGGRTLRERRVVEKKATVVVPKKAAAASGRSSSQPRAKPATASISEPNQMTPQKTAVTTTHHHPSPLNNPTPAMIELMQRINQKKALLAKGKPIAAKLLTNAVTTQNKKVKKEQLTLTSVRSASVVPSMNGDASKTVKRRPGRPPSSSPPKKANSVVANGTKRIPADRSTSPPALPEKRRPGRPPKSPASSVSPKLSSNSSTHSTKENKYVVPTRRSPRAAKK